MQQQESFYRPGLVFFSKASGYQLIIAQPKSHFFPDGSKEETRPIQVANFADESVGGSWRSEMTDYEGRFLTVNNKRGGAFDLDEASERLGWDEEQRERAARTLILACTVPSHPAYGDVSLFEPPAPLAPWKTYDDTHHSKIPSLASDLGVVAEALAYERFSKNREGVVKALEEKLADRAVEEELTAA